MTPRLSIAVCGVLIATLTSCGAIPTRTFEIRVKNSQSIPVKSLVVVNHDWPDSIDEAVFVDGFVTVPFERSKTHIHVYPVAEKEGMPVMPDINHPGEYLGRGRDLEITDPELHLFIVRRNPDF